MLNGIGQACPVPGMREIAGVFCLRNLMKVATRNAFRPLDERHFFITIHRKEVNKMIQPAKERFNKLSENFSVIPIFKTVPADLETPVSIYLKTAGQEKHSFLLESGDLGEQARYSFIGCDPFITLVTKGTKTVITQTGGKRWRSHEDPLNALQNVLKQVNIYIPEELTVFWGGAVGYLSYDLVKYWEKLPGLDAERSLPSCYFFFPRKMLIYDHRLHTLTMVVLVVLEETNDAEITYEKECAKMEKELKKINGAASRGVNTSITSSNRHGVNSCTFPEVPPAYFTQNEVFTKEDFLSAVDKAKDYIQAGEIFQVVLSRRVVKKISCRPFTLYRTMRSMNPSPYQFFLNLDEFQLIGASPEMMVKMENGFVYTKPIAGTRPRGLDEKGDRHLAGDLIRDEKERAEHMMLVDLGRNDLGKISAFGSVEVTKLLEVEYFSHVMHLVSEVRGSILKDYHFGDALKAAFAAGTVSGAPKVRAMEIIAELEPVSRGPYSGAVGYVSFDGKLDTCITIRTVITSGGYAAVQAGAGIVADSEPLKEFEETEHKMAGPIEAIRLAEEREHDLNYR